MSCNTLFLQFPWREISILPVQWHALCLGLFASIIAPFGGFFASGFKRAFKIKVWASFFSHPSWLKARILLLESDALHSLRQFSCFFQDFGDSIPGHGGITDRMDCQVGSKKFVIYELQVKFTKLHLTIAKKEKNKRGKRCIILLLCYQTQESIYKTK